MRSLLSFAALALAVISQAGTIVLDERLFVGGERSTRILHEVRQRDRTAATLTETLRTRLARAGKFDPRIPFALPNTVVLKGGKGGQIGPRVRGDLILQFDTGTTAFPPAYEDLLQSVFDQARPTMNLVFGLPSEAGDVRITNADATIPDRSAVSGGTYVAGSAGARQILFPVYSSPEAAAVNFLHCLLLAHQGRTPWPYDAQQEGLVRAAVMQVARTPGALPASLDPELIEAALANTYDVGPWYDWYNQPALASTAFIPANLFNTDLPSGGSVGGPYLLRHQMAGSAWYKAIIQNPGFLPELNRRYYLTGVSLAEDPAFITACQASLDVANSSVSSLIEGKSFATWLPQQFVLQRRIAVGPKVLVQPVPLPPEAGTSDFGVFDVVTHSFETRANGDEILLSGTAYPIFWENTFNRLFPSAQEDRMDIAGAYGSVTPNLPNILGGAIYRCAIDIPVGDRLQRTYVPVGAIATGSDTDEKNFYGTVIGLGSADSAKVRVKVGNTVVGNAPIINGAFGITVTNTNYSRAQRLTVEVIKTINTVDQVALTRLVNKAPGALSLDLRVGENIEFGPTGGIPKGLSLLGFSAEPYVGSPTDLLGANPLVARYNPNRAAYDLFPDTGDFRLGHAYFVRANVALPSFSVSARYHPGTPMSVALRPGWNLVSSPMPEDVPISRIRVVRAADFPKFYSDAVGTEVGLDFFEFTPGANDPATGAPETGTFGAGTIFRQGRGYFVRCLAPEGATLVFDPLTPLVRNGPRVAGKQPTWVIRAAVTKGRNVAMAFMGAAQDATVNFDRPYDSTLPPALSGGLQLAVEGKNYRDVRRINDNQTFRIKLTGLVVGQSYDLKLIAAVGNPGEFTLVDAVARVRARMKAPFSYPFTATSSIRWIEVQTQGRYR